MNWLQLGNGLELFLFKLLPYRGEEKPIELTNQIIDTMENLEHFPYIPPNASKFKALWDAARDKWPELADDLGYIGNDGSHAFFQIRGSDTEYKLPLSKVST